MKTKSEEQAPKKCSKCEEVKLLDEFGEGKAYADGHQSWCKSCMKEYRKIYDKQYYQDNKEKINERSKLWCQDNKDYRTEYRYKWAEVNKERVAKTRRKWQTVNREKRNEKDRLRRQNPLIKMRRNVSRAVYSALTRNNGSKDGASVIKHLPYTIPQLKEHLEKQFEPWMNWNNYGEWHLDHIYPQSKLPYDSMEHPNFLKAWALENLQPLEATENIRKGNKVLDK